MWKLDNKILRIGEFCLEEILKEMWRYNDYIMIDIDNYIY